MDHYLFYKYLGTIKKKIVVDSVAAVLPLSDSTRLKNKYTLARSTRLRPVTTLLGAFRHTRLHLIWPYRELARLRVEKKTKNAAQLCQYLFFVKLSSSKPKKIHGRLPFFKFVYTYLMDFIIQDNMYRVISLNEVGTQVFLGKIYFSGGDWISPHHILEDVVSKNTCPNSNNCILIPDVCYSNTI